MFQSLIAIAGSMSAVICTVAIVAIVFGNPVAGVLSLVLIFGLVAVIEKLVWGRPRTAMDDNEEEDDFE